MSKKKTEEIIKDEKNLVFDTSDVAIIETPKTIKNKKEEIVDDNIDAFNKNLDDFLSKTAGVDVKNLSEHEQVPFWINSGSYALNWIISGDMFNGIPGTKVILVSGIEACVGPDTKIKVKLPKEICEQEMTIKDLFTLIEKNDNIVIKEDEFVAPSFPIMIQNQNNNWVNIKKVIKKLKPTKQFTFDDSSTITVANTHKFISDPKSILSEVYAKDLQNKNILTTASGKKKVIKQIIQHTKSSEVYDFEIDTPDHLYQTADGLVHHNTGKSLLTDVWLGENIRFGGTSIKIDIEDAVGSDFTAKVIGSQEVADKIKIIAPNTKKAVAKAKGNVDKLKPEELVITIEKLTSILNKLIDYQLSAGKNKNKSILVAIDSISNLTSIKEIEDISADKNKKDMTPQQKMRAFFRAVNQKMKDANVTIHGIAHLTANIGVMFGPKNVISAKGTGFKYASSLTINCMGSKEIIDPKTEVAIGLRMKLQTTKNRMAYKGKTTFLYMYFNNGVDNYGGLCELLTQYNIMSAHTKYTQKLRNENKKKVAEGKETKNPPKATANLDKSYPDTAYFKYIYNNKELFFKAIDTGKICNENPGLLEEWNKVLNEEYQKALEVRGVTEDELLEEDPIEEE